MTIKLGDMAGEALQRRFPCWRKQQYATARAALAHKQSLIDCDKATAPGLLEVYECPHCECWHVGHNKRKGAAWSSTTS